MTFFDLFPMPKPLIGVIHLPPLPGHAGSPGINGVVAKAQKDLQTLVQAGFEGVLVENDGDDPPYFQHNEEISRSFAAVMKALRSQMSMPLGLEILYDMSGTIKLASEVDADFVRLDVFVDDVQHARGSIIKAQAKRLYELKMKLKPDLLLLADIQVKHTIMLDPTKTITQSAREVVDNGADAVVVTGSWTGNEPDITELIAAKQAATVPVLVGSGFASDNAKALLLYAAGAFVASSIKTNGYVDMHKAKQLVAEVQSSRRVA